MMTKKTAPTNQSPCKQGKSSQSIPVVSLPETLLEMTCTHHIFISQMENYIFDLLERLVTKNNLFLNKTQKEEQKEWQLLISL